MESISRMDPMMRATLEYETRAVVQTPPVTLREYLMMSTAPVRPVVLSARPLRAALMGEVKP